jgi:hypothetical protein
LFILTLPASTYISDVNTLHQHKTTHSYKDCQLNAIGWKWMTYFTSRSKFPAIYEYNKQGIVNPSPTGTRLILKWHLVYLMSDHSGHHSVIFTTLSTPLYALYHDFRKLRTKNHNESFFSARSLIV